MITFKILEQADQELQSSALWYEQEREGLGLRFVEVIQKKLKSIIEHPDTHPKRKGNFREATVQIFPFVIIYVYYKKEKQVTVFSIFHTSRNPRKKFKKTKPKQR